jgi:hypothetical protein
MEGVFAKRASWSRACHGGYKSPAAVDLTPAWDLLAGDPRAGTAAHSYIADDDPWERHLP